MSENTGGSSRKRKAISATLAIAMATTMLLSGTLAYFYQSKAVNTFKSEKKEAYGHDDFIEGKNKDVYVENTGGTDIYVRVKLEESFTHNGETKATTVAHIPNADKKVEKHKGSDGIHDHFQWVLGQEGVTKAFLSATSDQYKDTGDKVIETGEYGKVVKDNSGATYTDEDTTSNTDGVVTTAESKGVITMEEYITMGTPTSATPTDEEIATAKAAQKAWQGWVMDTNGWVYWSQKVKPGQATGLLLDNVIVDKTIANDQYQYDIDVTFQAVDDSDIKVWTKGLTELADGGTVMQQSDVTLNAKTLLAILQGEESYAAKLEKKMEETESEGARHLYRLALQQEKGLLRDSNAGSTERVEELADAADARYDASVKTTTVNGETITYHEGFETVDPDTGEITEDIFVELNPDRTSIVKNNSTVPDSLVIPIIQKNFSMTGYKYYKITKDLAMGIVGVQCDEDVDDLSWITPSNFPSLNRLYIPNYTETYTASETKLHLDATIAGQLQCLGLRNNKTIKTIDLAGYDQLLYFDCNESENLTEIQNYPDGLLALGVPGTQVKVDLNDPALSKMEMLLLNGATMNDTNNLNVLKTSNTMRYLSVGVDVNLNTLDLSEADNLYYFDLRTNEVDGTTHAASIEHIKFSDKAFCSIPEVFAGGFRGAYRADLILKYGSALQSLDISTYTGLNNYEVDLTGCTGLKGVCRKYDQKGFKKYPTVAGDGIYERIVGADGNNTYRLHNGNTVTDVTDPAKIAELDADTTIFNNGAA